MSNHWVTPAKRRILGRTGAATGVALGLLLCGSPPGHADEGGLLGDATGAVGTTVEQVVEPVAPPVEEVVEQVVAPVVAPLPPAVDPVTEPVVRVIEPVVGQASEPVVRVVEPEADPAPAASPVQPPVRPPVQAQVPATDGQDTGPAGVTRAEPSRPRAERSPSTQGDRPRPASRTPRPIDGHGPSRRTGARDDAADEALSTLTNALMHLWAGAAVPGSVDAGLGPEAIDASPPPWQAPLVVGLLLGLLSLVLARRQVTGPVAGTPSR